jgi:hypothetical protein
MNNTLSKLGDLDEFKSALDIKPYIHYNDGDILSKLNIMYRDNPEELNLIEQAYTECRCRYVKFKLIKKKYKYIIIKKWP